MKLKYFYLTVFIFLISLNVKAQFRDSTELNWKIRYRIRITFAYNLGVFNPKDFYDWVDKNADTLNTKSGHSFDNIGFGFRISLGYRINKRIDIMFNSEQMISMKNLMPCGNFSGGSINFSRASIGGLINYRIYVKPREAVLIGGGILSHEMTITSGKHEFYKSRVIGPKFNVGYNFDFREKGEIQLQIGYDYIKGKDKGLVMNYSGVYFGIGVVF